METMKERNLKILHKALEGVELTEGEKRFVDWLAGWDYWTADQAVSIIKKCRQVN